MTYPKDVLNTPILQLSESDVVRFRDLIEGGTLITGGLGSGKSSTSAKSLALSFLSSGIGGLVLTVKSDETKHWIEYAKSAGRFKDLVIFNAESGLVFDPLAYMWNSGGRAAGHIETIVELFSTLMNVGKQHVGINNDRYWELAAEELQRAVIVMLSAAGERISIASIHQIITSLPTEPAQADDPGWLTSTPCGRLILKLRERRGSFTSEQLDDLDIAIPFALERWPKLDPRTSSNIQSTWSGMASKFTFHPFSRMFCSGRYDFTPEQTTHERKVIILDFPVLEYGRETSRLCQILVKIIFQRAWLRHQFQEGCCNGAFCFQDEFALLMHKLENPFHMTCRGSGIAPVCITPNILNIAAEEFGEQKPGAKTLGFLGLLSLKIFHNQTDIETCNYAADQIGKEYRYLDNFHTGTSGHDQTNASFGGSRQLVHILEPIAFTQLETPDSDNPCSQAIVYHRGRSFNATKTAQNPRGLNYLPVVFSRK